MHETKMKLNIKNPIIFFDLETTGINVAEDRIVELSYIKVYPNGKEESETIRVNPGIPIPKEATALHGISDADVAGAPVFKEIAKHISRVFEGCDLAGFNSDRFDIPLLAEEMIRADAKFDVSRRSMIDVQTIFHKMEQRTLSAAYKFYCGKTLENAHSAGADTRATYEVLQAQLDRYPDLPNDVAALSEFSSYNRNVDFAGKMVYDENGCEIFNFGKYKGQKVTDVFRKDPSYYDWMMKGVFTLNTKKILTEMWITYQRNR